MANHLAVCQRMSASMKCLNHANYWAPLHQIPVTTPPSQPLSPAPGHLLSTFLEWM